MARSYQNLDTDHSQPPAVRSLRELVEWAEARLAAAPLTYGHGTDNPRDEAVWLAASAAGLSPVDPDLDPDYPVSAEATQRAARLVERRIVEQDPVAYLTGRAWFAGLEFQVDARALVPRSPLAEPIAERFAPWVGERSVERILDIGTGCGCIAIACAYAFPEARVHASDSDTDALALAAENVRRHGLAERVELFEADVFEGLPPGRYDLIVSNPPYVDEDAMATLPAEYRREPAHALAAGPKGLDVVDRIVSGAAERLRTDGVLVVEVGRAAAELQRREPQRHWLWLDFAHGGEGVFLLTADQVAP
ncbi:MAG: 50S ribosomal protein L3 N(5)-glutamine methyltransferase [Halofilum sp. (in: g-proteobacteria)]